MDSNALQQLFAFAEEEGTTLLITGPLGLDAYWKATDRADHIVGQRSLGNVQREELLNINGVNHRVTYGRRRIAEVAKETLLHKDKDTPDEVTVLPLGKGKLIWTPLPLELNGRDEPLAALYRYATEIAGVEQELEWISGGDIAGVYGRKLSFPKGHLYVFVSEFALNHEVHVRDQRTGVTYAFQLEKNRSVLFTTDASGKLNGVYRPDEVEIVQQ